MEAAANEIFEAHHLELVPVKKGERTPFEYRIKPVEGKTWEDAAYAIRETIHGVGIFDIPVERGDFGKIEFEGEPARQWVLTRKHHMAYYPEVYGTASAERIYERSWR